MPKQSPGHPAGPLNNALVLNQDQEAASQAIFQFLLSEEKEFSISGPAGTGKTTLMKHVMTSLLPEYSDACKLLGIKPLEFEIVLTATTNKATEVLSSATGFPAQTIHSYMSLKVFDDYKTGVSKISPTKNFQIHSRKLIFIDEASMVDGPLTTRLVLYGQLPARFAKKREEADVAHGASGSAGVPPFQACPDVLRRIGVSSMRQIRTGEKGDAF